MRTTHIFHGIPDGHLNDLEAVLTHAIECTCTNVFERNANDKRRVNPRDCTKMRRYEAELERYTRGRTFTWGLSPTKPRVRYKKTTVPLHAIANLRHRVKARKLDRLTAPQVRYLQALLKKFMECPGFRPDYGWRRPREMPSKEQVAPLMERLSNDLPENC